MKIVLVGNGWLPIPPPGWGAVEILLWDIHNELVASGHDVHIVNVIEPEMALDQIRRLDPDLVHLNFARFGVIIPHLLCPVLFTCHDVNTDAFIEGVFPHVTPETTIIALNPGTRAALGIFPRVRVVPNGMNPVPFRFSLACALPERSIYVGSLCWRKRQHLFRSIASLDFVGNALDDSFPLGHPTYKGHWNREQIYNGLTDYANLVLLSEHEEQGIVICEAMFCGLGVVCSESPARGLDTTRPWITVIPDNKIHDLAYVESEIERNRVIALQYRSEIRAYGVHHFSIGAQVDALYFNQNNH